MFYKVSQRPGGLLPPTSTYLDSGELLPEYEKRGYVIEELTAEQYRRWYILQRCPNGEKLDHCNCSMKGKRASHHATFSADCFCKNCYTF